MSEKKPNIQPKPTLFQHIDSFFDRYQYQFFILSMLITAIMGFFLYDTRISEGGDDSGYIESAKLFMDGAVYPGFRGPFYSIFLSWMIRIFGFHLQLFKITSFLFLLGHLAFFYYTFRGKVSPTLLVFSLLLSSMSAELLYFGSQTYSEAMFMFLQSALFFLVIRYLVEIKDHFALLYRNWWVVLTVGLLLFLMSKTRNIGIVTLGAVLLFLITERKFYLAGYTLGSYLLFQIPYSLYKNWKWGISGSDLGAQLSFHLRKSPYNPALGNEDLAGMVTRFIENSKIYLSNLLMHGMELKNPDHMGTSGTLTIILYILFMIGLFFAIKRSRIMRFTAYYLGIILFFSFTIIHQSWGQMRLIIIFLPLLYLFLPWGWIELSKTRKLNFLQPVTFLLLAFLLIRVSARCIEKASDNYAILKQNLKGDKYYGYTQDWQNYLKISEWASENIPEESLIASRKPSMSFVYGNGRHFFGIYNRLVYPSDTVLGILKKHPGEPLIINEKEWRLKDFSMEMESRMKRGAESFITVSNSIYSVIYPPDNFSDSSISLLGQSDIQYMTDLDQLAIMVHANEGPKIAIVPDSLAAYLLGNNVEYMIAASLRRNPKKKDGRVVETVHFYSYYLNQKYPGMVTIVKQFGNLEEEPAVLYRIDWDKYNLRQRILL